MDKNKQGTAVLGQYKGIPVEPYTVTVSDAEIADVIRKERMHHARMQSVSLPARYGDTVLIDFTGYQDGVPFDGGNGKNYALKLGSGQFIPGFEDRLVGSVKDSTVHVEVTFPKEYPAANLAGKPVLFTVDVKDVQRPELPEWNDAFIRKISPFKTCDEYVGQLRIVLKEQKEEHFRMERRRELMEAVLKEAKVTVPDERIAEEAEMMMNNLKMRLSAGGMSPQQYFASLGVSEEAVRNELMPQAEQSAKEQLVLEAVAEAEGLSVSEEEIAEEYRAIARQHNTDARRVREMLGEAHDELIRRDLLLQKAMKVLEDTAVIVQAA